MRLTPSTFLALIAVQAIFAVHYLAAKMVVEAVPPRAWALVRVAVAAVILLALDRVRNRGIRIPRRDVARLALFALFGVVINQISFTEGIHRTTPAHSSLINTLIPVSTFLSALLLRNESLTRRKGVGMAIAFAGVLLLLRVDAFDFSARWVRGDLLTLLNASSFGFFLAVSRNTVRRYPPLTSTAYTMAFGTAGIALVGAPAAFRFDWSSLPTELVLVMAGIILFATVLNYVLNYYALSRVDSSTVALFIYLQPLLATLLSVGLGRETLSPRFPFSALLVFLGVFLVARAPRPTPRARILEAE